jgi:hypothetical protein
MAALLLFGLPGAGAAQTALPESLFAPVGTLITILTVDPISTEDDREGESFQAVLYQPLVVDGWVVARPGQTVIGRVTQSERGGRTSGSSMLGVELIEIVLVDGQQAPLRTQLFVEAGPASSAGEDATMVGVGTGVGAAAGAGVGGGSGAAIGAAIGAGAGILGALVTRGDDTRIRAESMLTFRLDAPLTVSTTRSPQAFRAVMPEDYDRPPVLQSADRSNGDDDDDWRRGPRFPSTIGIGVGVGSRRYPYPRWPGGWILPPRNQSAVHPPRNHSAVHVDVFRNGRW